MSLQHVHSYSSDSFFHNGHAHRLSGTTSSGFLTESSHVHHFRGVTSVENGHVHFYEGTTGPAATLASGGHTHQCEGCTSVNEEHDHDFYARTERESVGNIFK